MTWPLDVFEAAYVDAWEFVNRERGVKDTKSALREKAKHFKERAKARGSALVGWWVNG